MTNFTADERSLRREWFNLLETPDQWKELNQLTGESYPVRVENCRTGRKGVAKPGPRKAAREDLCRAAHEKLAYDLAYLLDLPVSPVVLWPEGAPEQYKRGRSISAWAFEQSATWKTADEWGIISHRQMEAALPIVSAMHAFHIWIGDLDRNTSQFCINLAPQDEGALELSFFDHSFSMSYYWNSDDTDTPNLPNEFALPRMREVVMETAGRIKALSDDEIERLAMRIKEPYLPDNKRRYIISNLLRRKAKLQDVLNVTHGIEDRRREG
jgi:hypothetical protein